MTHEVAEMIRRLEHYLDLVKKQVHVGDPRVVLANIAELDYIAQALYKKMDTEIRNRH